MGNRMKCVTTTKTVVMQGDANTNENRCVTTTTPKGGVGGGDAASPVRREVVRNLVPMPPLAFTGRVAVRAFPFALCRSGVLK
jgi:hypothetical protein